MRNKNNLIFIIPVYNEEEVIEKVVENIFLNLKKFEFKILLINDGSRDKSLDKIKIIKSQYTEKVEYIDQENIGHGPTVIKGYKYAIDNDYEYIFQIDSDNQFDILDFEKLWIYREKYHLISGLRKKRKDTLIRKYLTKIVKIFIFVLFFVKIKDSNCPFRLIQKDFLVKALENIKSEILIPNIFISIIAAKNKSLFFTEITHLERKTGKVSIVNVKLLLFCVKALFQILIFRFKLKLW